MGTVLLARALRELLKNLFPSSVGEHFRPLSAIAVPEDLTGLFAPARNMQIKPEYPQQALPTQEEAIYLYSVVERVVLKGYRPPSFLDGARVAAMEGVDRKSTL